MQPTDSLEGYFCSNHLCESQGEIQSREYRFTMKHRRQLTELPKDKNVQRKWEAIYRVLFPDPDQPTQSNPKGKCRL